MANILNPLERRAIQIAQQKATVRAGALVRNPLAPQTPPKAQVQATEGQSAMAAAFGGPKPQQSLGRLGSLLNNPISKAVTTAMGVIDVPRRAFISGLHEIADLGGDIANGTDRASFGDFMSQAKDPMYGAGQYIDSGNKWVDRLGGFVGDVALDPMTYLTFGAGKFSGLPGRLAAGIRVAEAGLDATKVARLGVLAAKGAEREAIFAGMKGADELAQPGLRFLGARIPGTGRAAEVVGEGLARGRARLGDTAVGQGMRNLRAPAGMEQVYKTLARGEAGTNDALAMVARGSRHSAERNLFEQTFAAEADKLAHDAKKAGEAADRAAFTALDEGLPLDELGAKGRAFFDKTHADAEGKIPAFQYRQDYAPRTWTADARKAWKGDEFQAVREAVGMDVTEATGGAVRRKIEPGTVLDMPDGSQVHFVADTANGAVSARQINEKLAPILKVNKVVEDRLSQVLKPHVEGLADATGRAQGLLRLQELADTGGLVPDVKATKKATQAAGVAQGESLGKASKVAVKGQKAVAKELDQGGAEVIRTVVAQAQKQLDGAKAALDAAKVAEKRAGKAAGGLDGVRTQVTRDAEAAVSAAQKQLDDLAGEQRVLHEFEVSERATIDTAKKDAKLAHDAELKRAKRAASNAKTAPMVDKNGKPLRGAAEGASRSKAVAAAEARVSDASGAIPETEAARQARESVTAEVAKRQADISARRDSALGKMATAERKVAKSYDQIDAAHAAAQRARMDAKDSVASLKAEVVEARKLLTKAKAVRTAGSKPTQAAYKKIETDLDAVFNELGHFPGVDDVKSLMSWYAKGVAELRDGDDLNKYLGQMQKMVTSGKIAPVMKYMIQDGYEKIGVSLLGDQAPIVRKQLAEQLRNLEKGMKDPGFFKMIDKYTQFFKTYATATVGFHVRNGMSATFMNASDGVSVRNMGRGTRLWEMIERNPQTWTDNLPSYVTREQAEDAARAVFASGGGGGQYGKAELALGKSKVVNNAYTRFSQRAGGRVEGYVRMGMALDTVLGGGTWEEAASRITRIHFDYSQVSKMDATMKRIIPFWTFMSRNLPLQMQQMFLKPRMYQVYNNLARNMGGGEDSDMIPLSWREQGAFKITDGVYVAPDLPFTRLETELSKLSDPQRLLADANPLFKVPFETMVAGKKLYNDQTFEENGFESVSGGGLELLAPVLSALGLTDTAGDGTEVIDERLGYGLRGLLPPAAQIQRLFGDDPYYSDKRGQSIANNIGVPLRLLTEGQKSGEQKRRNRASKKKTDAEAKRDALMAWSKG